MVTLPPTATKVLIAKVTTLREFEVPEVLEVHEVPSEEVRIFPGPPTATNFTEFVVFNSLTISSSLL